MARETSVNGRNPPVGVSSYIDMQGEKGDSVTRRPTLEECKALSDRELLELIVRRTRAALEALYERYSGAVYSLAVHMLRDKGAAEEVAQDSFFNVWRRASSFRSDRGAVAPWLFSIAHHRVIDEVRRRRRREQSHVIHDVDLVNQPADDTSDPMLYAML